MNPKPLLKWVGAALALSTFSCASTQKSPEAAPEATETQTPPIEVNLAKSKYPLSKVTQPTPLAKTDAATKTSDGKKPNIIVIWGDDIGQAAYGSL
jgi:hypothetical protein